MDDIQECIRVIPETGHFIRVDFPSFVEADLNKKGDGMETTEYVVELKYFMEIPIEYIDCNNLDDYEIGQETITVQAVSEAQARITAINNGIRNMVDYEESYGVEVVSIKKRWRVAESCRGNDAK